MTPTFTPSITMEERALLYSLTYPKYPPLQVSRGVIFGVWMMGRNYERKRGYHGEHPPGYLPRILSLFPEVMPEGRLHIFGGTVEDPGATIVDINPSLKPDWAGPAADLPFDDDAFELALCDPPYTKADAAKYGYAMPNRKNCLAEACRVVRPGGHVIWLDTVTPIWANYRGPLVGIIGIFTSSNHVFRHALIFCVA